MGDSLADARGGYYTLGDLWAALLRGGMTGRAGETPAVPGAGETFAVPGAGEMPAVPGDG